MTSLFNMMLIFYIITFSDFFLNCLYNICSCMMQLLIQSNIFAFFRFISLESIYLLFFGCCFVKNNDLVFINLSDRKQKIRLGNKVAKYIFVDYNI